MKCAIVIPARMASTRFPGKPLVDLCGKPMVQWVWERSIAAGIADLVVVATPDEAIVEACKSFGAQAVLTRDDHVSGTDRVAEVAAKIDAGIFVNVQGDEPLIPPESIKACANTLIHDPGALMGSVMHECPENEFELPTSVKVVVGLDGYALYFSRYPIPYPRNPRVAPVMKHVGIYAYRKKALDEFVTWQPSPLEKAESLEQLRFLENGIRIKMAVAEGAGYAVDEPSHADAVRRLLLQGGSS